MSYLFSSKGEDRESSRMNPSRDGLPENQSWRICRGAGRQWAGRMRGASVAAAFLLIPVLALPPASRAQTAAAPADTTKKPVVGQWVPELDAGVNLAQSAYSMNWYGGEKGSAAWTALINGSLANQLSPSVNWSNTLNLAYGQTAQQAVVDNQLKWQKPDESTDLIALESILRFTLGVYVQPFASVRYESQFFGPPDSLGRSISLNPMRFLESGGIARQFVNQTNRTLLSRLGFGFRESIRRYYPDAGKTTKSETGNDGGLQWVTSYKSVAGRLSWTSNLTLYQPVFFSGKKKLQSLTAASLTAQGIDPGVADYPTRMSADWENILTSQVSKLISVNLYARWLYEKYDNTVIPVIDNGVLTNPGAVQGAIRKAGQFKETLALGVTYRIL